MSERKGAVTFKGNPLTLLGQQVEVGQKAPDFTALANDLTEVKLADLRDKVVIICSVPSLDTSVCDTETRKFNEKASEFGDDIAVVFVSMDLPFAQGRFCTAAGIENVKIVSDHRDASFGQNYGVLIKELRLLARAVFIVDKPGIIRYTQLVKEMSDEPDYDAALDAAGELL
ncbi:MAG: thiol peroxidase [Sedimentisphaerales bacterium]|nr:thiol peroxidase [Sedimentisphaerales bacterium]